MRESNPKEDVNALLDKMLDLVKKSDGTNQKSD